MKSGIQSTQIFKRNLKNPHISQRELAAKNGISLGKVNLCHQRVDGKGLRKDQKLQGIKKQAKYVYLLTPKGMYAKAKLASDFLKWKMDEYERLKKEIDELENEINRQRLGGAEVLLRKRSIVPLKK